MRRGRPGDLQPRQCPPACPRRLRPGSGHRLVLHLRPTPIVTQAGAQPTPYRTPIVRYATFRPLRSDEVLLWGTATLNPGAHGWTWQQEGCDWTTTIKYNDPRLQVYGLVDEDEPQLPLFPTQAA